VFYIPLRILHWDTWIAFAGASIYLLWELTRVNDALAELADLWNEQHRARQEAEREVCLQRRQKRDNP
jgi:hypothetical protein